MDQRSLNSHKNKGHSPFFLPPIMRSSVGQCCNIRFRQLYAGHVIITSVNISRSSWPVLIKLYMYHCWDGGLTAYNVGTDLFKTVVIMATERSHRHTVGENVVRAIAPSVLNATSLNLQISRRGNKSWTCSNSGQVEHFVLELLALER